MESWIHDGIAARSSDEDIAGAYRAYVVNECIAAGARLEELPMSMPFNKLVQMLITLTARRAERETRQLMEWAADAAVEKTQAKSALTSYG